MLRRNFLKGKHRTALFDAYPLGKLKPLSSIMFEGCFALQKSSLPLGELHEVTMKVSLKLMCARRLMTLIRFGMNCSLLNKLECFNSWSNGSRSTPTG